MSVQPVNRSSSGVGFSLRQVVVKQVVTSRGIAICQETSGHHLVEVALLPIRVRMPLVGEKWLTDRTFGFWSFAAILPRVAVTPVVTGSRQRTNDYTGALEPVDPITLSLLAALVKLGLVIDKTV